MCFKILSLINQDTFKNLTMVKNEQDVFNFEYFCSLLLHFQTRKPTKFSRSDKCLKSLVVNQKNQRPRAAAQIWLVSI